MTKPNLAEQALYDGYKILCTLASITENANWFHSVHSQNLDRSARKLRYKDIQHLYETVDGYWHDMSETMSGVYEVVEW